MNPARPRIIHNSTKRPGSAQMVEATKNQNQSSWTTSQPPPDDSTVRPTAAREENSAYWVAVNSKLQSLDR